MVVEPSFKAMLPRDPFFGRSFLSSASSISSGSSSGVARRIELKFPTDWLGVKVTVNSYIDLD